MSTCKGCGAEIIWIKTINNKNMPIDAKPLKVYVTENRIELIGAADSSTGYRLTDAHTIHWVTCPEAKQFKKKGN